MFRVNLNHIAVHYLDCPAAGLSAVDWRRSRGLPDAPTSLAGLLDPNVFTCEPLCRLRPDLTNGDADLAVSNCRVLVPQDHVAALHPYLSGQHTLPDPLPTPLFAALALVVAGAASKGGDR